MSVASEKRDLKVPVKDVAVGMWSSPCCLLDTYRIKDEEELAELLSLHEELDEGAGLSPYVFFRTAEDALAYYYDDDGDTFMSDELRAALGR